MQGLRAFWGEFATSYDVARASARRTPRRMVVALLAGFAFLVVPAYVPALVRMGSFHAHWGVYALFVAALASSFGFYRSRGAPPWGPVWVALDTILWTASLSFAIVTTTVPVRYAYEFVLGFVVIGGMARDLRFTWLFALLLCVPTVGIVAMWLGPGFTLFQSLAMCALGLWVSYLARREQLRSRQLREALDLTDSMATRSFELALTRTALTVGHTLHELRNHLFVVGAALEYLRETPQPDPSSQDAIRDASKGFEAARSVLDATMAKLREARKLASVEFDAARTVEAEVAATPVNGAALRTDFDGKGFIVSGDQDGLRMAVGNLIRNAVQAGAKNIGVFCGVHDGGDALRVEVSDDGRGIPPDVANEIFKAFETGHASEGGTGLGLYLSRRQIELMGGTITVSPQPGRGTRFTIVLPGRVARRS